MTDTKVNLKLVVAEDPPDDSWMQDHARYPLDTPAHGPAGMRTYVAGTGGKGEAFLYSGGVGSDPDSVGWSLAWVLRVGVCVFLAGAVIYLLANWQATLIALDAILHSLDFGG